MHFTLIVFDQGELDDLLAPFNEQLDVEPYDKPIGDFALKYGTKRFHETRVGRNVSQESLAKFLTEYWEEPHFVRDGEICARSTRNPNGRWDWWVIGGRWRGFFPLKEGVEYDAEWHLGEPGTGERIQMNNGEGPYKDYKTARRVDRVKVKNIDFDRQVRERQAEAKKRFLAWQEVLKGKPRPKSWPELREEHKSNYKAARDVYNRQPAISAWRKSETKQGGFSGCPVEELGFSLDSLLIKTAYNSLAPYAILYQGSWTTSEDYDDENKSWGKHVHSIFEFMDPEAVVTLVDYHS